MRTTRIARLALCCAFVSILFTEHCLAEEVWPELPAANGAIEVPAQEWPLRPGPRTVRVLVHYPRGKLANVDAKTGLMLTLHNWGGEDCAGTANPQVLADKLNVIALCVNYLQSGAKDSIEGPEPYDFGYLQALDSLRALWLVREQLKESKQPFAAGRIFVTGGSGGGNVALMANKLAPRTFACVIDLCGMKQLSADIAFNLPGGSSLDARYRRDRAHPHYLSGDAQDLRFIGHPGHLRVMQRLKSTAKVIIVHGVDDTTCPFAEARQLVANMQAAKLDVEPHYVDKARIDGKIFTSTGHALGDRTQIVLTVAGENLAADGEKLLRVIGPTDFDLKDENVRYETPQGTFVISYRAGHPIGRFEPKPAAPSYAEHQDLTYFLDAAGKRQPIKTLGDWQIRRGHIVQHWQAVAGVMPGASWRVPLDVKVLEETDQGTFIRRKLSFQSDPFDRCSAWLLIPKTKASEKLPAMLCLHQTTPRGKDETIGLVGREAMHYGRELAERGYVVLCPDYPSFGEHPFDFAAQQEFPSGTLKAVWDNSRAVDLLVELPQVDAERIGVIGHSLGGHNAIFSALLEPRLKVIVSSCGFTRFHKDDVPSWTGPSYMPWITSRFGNQADRVPFDFTELVAALAPRPFLACAATKDDDFDVSGVRDVMASAQRVYQLHDREAALQAEYPETPHEFPAAARRRAYEFLAEHLRSSPKKSAPR